MQSTPGCFQSIDKEILERREEKSENKRKKRKKK